MTLGASAKCIYLHVCNVFFTCVNLQLIKTTINVNVIVCVVLFCVYVIM